MIPNTKKNINVLIPDGESFFTLSVLNCLSQHKNIDIHIVYSSKEFNGVKYSNKIKSYAFYYKTEDVSDFVDFLKQKIIKYNIDILMPLHFKYIRIVSKYKKVFQLLGINTLYFSIDILDRVNDKWELYKILKKNNIPTPKTYNNSKSIDFPLLYKPRVGIGGSGIKVINSKNELEEQIKKNPIDNYILQEFIKGYDIDCSVLCKDGEILAFTIQKGLSYSSKPFTPPIMVDFLYDKRLFEMIKKLVKTTNWTGVANVDLRYDENDNSFKVIEINPRFWGSVEASCLVGVNFPYLYCMTSLEIPFEIPKYRFKKYANNRALIKILRSKFSFNKNIMKIPEYLTIKYDILDPLPKITKYSYKIYNKILLSLKWATL